MEHYRTYRLLPRDGGFAKDIVLPTGEGMDGLVALLQKELDSLESYRAWYRRVLPRGGKISCVLAEWYDNTISQLIVHDLVTIGSEVRLRPTEDARLSRQLESGILASAPSAVVEAIAASSPSAKDAAALKAASSVAAQLHVSRRPKRILVVVDGW
jgi:hypothetical protein